MGGFGSGRRGGSGRTMVEACRSIDVNQLHRKGCLRAGWMGGWQWTRNGEKVGSINLRAEHDRLHLTYCVRVGGGNGRTWPRPSTSSACPAASAGRGRISLSRRGEGIACGRRVAKLQGRGAISCAVIATGWPTPARVKAHRTACSGARTRSGAARRRSRHGRALPAEAERHVASHLRTAARTSREAELHADEAFALRAERLVARIDNSNARGASGNERDQAQPAGGDLRPK